MPTVLAADSAFIIGHTHQDTAKPCQDYALSRHTADFGLAIVSDGCSSGGRTDLGARLWAHAASEVLSDLLQREGLAALNDLDRCAQFIGKAAAPALRRLDFDDGYATLVLAACDGRQASALVLGDGVVVVRFNDGRLKYWDVSYECNAPRYVNYERDPERLGQWQALVGTSLLHVSVNEYDAEGKLLSRQPQTMPAASTRGYLLTLPDPAELAAIFVCTDGATSFENRSNYQGLLPLTQVKNPAGQFMQRRLGALVRGWRKAGERGPADDLAVAALWLGDAA